MKPQLLAACVLLSACGQSPLAPTPPPLPDAVAHVYHGPPLLLTPRDNSTPRPTVIYLALDGETTERDYRTAVEPLLARGWLAVTFDLPYHSPGSPNLASWKDALVRGEDLIGNFSRTFSSALDSLIASGHTDQSRIVAVGYSRGGFLALHAAARDARVKAVAGLHPVTDLRALAEFAGAEADPHVLAARVHNQAPALRQTATWLSIGATDTRVSTSACMEFVERLRSVGAAVTFVPSGSPTHAIPQSAKLAAGDWLAQF